MVIPRIVQIMGRTAEAIIVGVTSILTNQTRCWWAVSTTPAVCATSAAPAR
jgi:hypothetical protein